MTSPAQIVIFGASGDLTRRKLVPALARLAADGRAKRPFSVLGVSRSEKSDESFRAELAEAMPEDARAAFESLAPRVHYQPGDVGSPDSLAKLSGRLDALPGGRETGRLFYLSLAPDLFSTALEHLSGAGLLASAEHDTETWRRVVVEKPFGHDLESARALNATLHRHVREDQIYRMDHYLGKETVQNILMFRFANTIFEPLWNQKYITRTCG